MGNGFIDHYDPNLIIIDRITPELLVLFSSIARKKIQLGHRSY
jgi:hypothetical protein